MAVARSLPEPSFDEAAPAPARAAAPTFVAPRDPDRFELKYWVPEEMTQAALEYARPYLILDPEIAKRGLQHQCSTSLYLETADLASFRTHVDGAPDRFKLRVRAYGDPPAGMAFFEIKRKLDSRGVKTRAAVPLESVQSYLEGRYDRLPDSMKPSARRNLESFLYAQLSSQAQPFLLVRAYRESYCSADPREETRMTFDRRICYQPARGASFDHDPNGWIPINGEEEHGQQGEHTLIEMKFAKLPPFWMKRVIQQLGLARVSFSKYCAAVRSHLDQKEAPDRVWDAVPRSV
ncbi:MAG TPA: polyphosphate polymerase domain-containing protein [Polyangia bacterium]|nr:polyphosphate polymerase domain-containing protein [Polyangia bacterium]